MVEAKLNAITLSEVDRNFGNSNERISPQEMDKAIEAAKGGPLKFRHQDVGREELMNLKAQVFSSQPQEPKGKSIS